MSCCQYPAITYRQAPRGPALPYCGNCGSYPYAHPELEPMSLQRKTLIVCALAGGLIWAWITWMVLAPL